MATAFDAAMASACAVLDGVFGEEFLLEPMAAPAAVSGRHDVNADPIVSSSRPTVPFVGCYVAPGALLHAHGRRMAESATQAVISDRPMIDVAEVALPAPVHLADRVHRSATGEVFVIAGRRPGDLGRIWLQLNAVERSPEMDR